MQIGRIPLVGQIRVDGNGNPSARKIEIDFEVLVPGAIALPGSLE
jgi:hypothetical protein